MLRYVEITLDCFRLRDADRVRAAKDTFHEIRQVRFYFSDNNEIFDHIDGGFRREYDNLIRLIFGKRAIFNFDDIFEADAFAG